MKYTIKKWLSGVLIAAQLTMIWSSAGAASPQAEQAETKEGVPDERRTVVQQIADAPYQAAPGALFAPTLDALPALTNRSELQIKGRAPLGSDVAVYYRQQDGTDIRVGSVPVTDEVYGQPQTGSFLLTADYSIEGRIEIYAVAQAGGQSSPASASQVVEFDLTAPLEPGEVEWQRLAYNELLLTWRAPDNREPNPDGSYSPDPTVDSYTVKRNGEVVAARTKDLFFKDTGLPESEMISYQLIAHDRAGNDSEPLNMRAATFHRYAVELARVPGQTSYKEELWNPTVSLEGNKAAFIARLFSLPGSTGPGVGLHGLYQYDMAAGSLERVAQLPEYPASLKHDGLYTMSEDGRYVAYASFERGWNMNDIYIWDTVLKQVDNLGVTDEIRPKYLSLSADGQWLAFTSDSNRLVPGDENEAYDAFLYHAPTKSMKRISMAGGQEGNGDSLHTTISADGRYAAFISQATNLPGGTEDLVSRLYMYDTASGELQPIAMFNANGQQLEVENASLSADGQTVAVLAAPRYGAPRLYVHDRRLQTTTPILDLSSTLNVSFGKPKISADGRFISFSYSNRNPGDGQSEPLDVQFGALRYDRQLDRWTRIGDLSRQTVQADISGDGSRAVFQVGQGAGSAVYAVCFDGPCSDTKPPDGRIQRVQWSIPRSVNGEAPIGSQLQVAAFGSQGQQLRAVMTYKEQGGLERQIAQPLAEDTAALGVYKSLFLLPDNALQVVSIRAESVIDPAVSAMADKLPLHVAGELKVNLTGAYADQMKGASVVLWSGGHSYSSSFKLTGELSKVWPVAGADDYRLQLLDPSGRKLLEQQPLAVSHGARTETTLTPRPYAELTVKLSAPGGESIEDAQVRFLDGQGRLISVARAQDGLYRLAGDRHAEDEIVIRFEMKPEYEAPGERRITLVPGVNEVAVTVSRLDDGEVYGIVTDTAGLPLPGVTVKLLDSRSGRLGGRTVTDEQGSYRIKGSVGSYVLHAEKTGYPVYRLSEGMPYVTIAERSSQEMPLVMTSRGYGSIKLDFSAKPLDAPLLKLDILDWRQAVDYRIQVTGDPYGQYVDPRRISDNLVPIVASPGDSLQVCLDHQFNRSQRLCTQVLIDDRIQGVAALRMEEKSRVTGRVLGLDDFRGVMSRLTNLDTGENMGTVTLDALGNYRGEPRETGKYQLVFSAPGNRRYTQEFTIQEGQIVELPPFRLDETVRYFEGKPGNWLQAKAEAASGEDVAVQGRYYLNGEQVPGVEDAKLQLRIPAGASLVAGSVTLDGVPVEPERISDTLYGIQLGTVSFGQSGSIQYRLRIGAAGSGRLAAEMNLSFLAPGALGQERLEETVGHVYIDPIGVTMTVPRHSSDHRVYVSGRAPKGSRVTVYADQEAVGTTETGPGGYWYADVSLPVKPSSSLRQDGATYALIAKADGGGGIIESEMSLINVDTSHVQLQSILMRQSSGRPITFNPKEGVARFPYVVVPGHPLEFIVTANNGERVSNMKVWIGKQSYPASDQGDSNTFKAYMIPNGSLDSGIYVTYDVGPKVYSKLPPRTAEDWQVLKSELPQGMQQTIYEPATAAEAEKAFGDAAGEGFYHSPVYKLTLPDAERTVAYARISLKGVELGHPSATKPFRGFTTQKDEASGRVDFTSIMATDVLRPEAQAAFKELQAQAQLAGDTISTDHVVNVLSLVSDSAATKGLGYLNTAKTYIEDGFDFADYADKILEFQQYVRDSECHGPSVENFIDFSNELYEDASDGLVAKSILTGLGLVAGVATGGLAGFAYATVLTALGDSVKPSWQERLDQLKQDFEENKKWFDDMAAAGAIDRCKKPEEEPEDTPDKKDQVAESVWVWDPSGYVYEAVEGNRVEGVKATIYQQDAAAGEWLPWSAEWFGQQNPLMTDAEGRYGWDVPEGKWQVWYEKEGYLPARSEELTVLPPHFDVNIPMISLLAPEVWKTAASDAEGIRLLFSKYMLADTVVSSGILAETADGEAIGGRIEAVDPVPDAKGNEVAKSFRFVPAAPLQAGAEVRIKVLAQAASYAAVPLEADYEKELTVRAASEAPSEAVSQVEVTPGVRQLLVKWKEADAFNLKQINVYWKRKGAERFESFVEVERGLGFAVLDGLESGAGYELKLVTVSTGGGESAGVLAESTVAGQPLDMDLVPPEEAGAFRTAEIRQDRLTALWSDPADADLRGLYLSWRRLGDSGYGKPIWMEKGAGRAEIAGLSPGTAYELKLETVDRRWNQSKGSVIQAVTPKSGSANPDNGDETGSGSGGNSGQPAPGTKEPQKNELEVLEVKEGAAQRWSGFDGGIVLELPAGAFRGGQQLQVSRIARGKLQLPDAAAGYSDGFRVMAEGGGMPLKPVKLTLRYDASRLTGLDARQLGLFRQDEAKPEMWHYAGGVLKSSAAELSADIGRLGTYAVLALPLPRMEDLQGHWAQADIEVLLARQMVDGVSAREFLPDEALTRAQAVKLLMELLDAQSPAAGRSEADQAPPPFGDVAPSAWYYSYVARAAQRGLVQGSDGLFRPDEPVSREAIAALLIRVLGLEAQAQAKAEELAKQEAVSPFADSALISGWAAGYVELARELGVMDGMSENRFEPSLAATRAQGAVLILRVMDRLGLIGR
ncbi:WD40-like Beta Propeller Repeat [Paenibacillus sp. UNCCL117]|uniref:S-layer homology domain-containing protein n=1 Tax=unclassified Paenibacillus TaxID=185978 RepID=UPI00087FEED9|nr:MULTISPECIES: S-layer homology domain-containing protein [unclassified Paenibacillus]SDD80094.1 WD40-like Beta Propeller Repeat [Paenibacillus sp. cl123]SFW53344.1 WD40-like Beta Propeller Repeat [Paenibacillus sp. UNCCL117]